MKDNINELIKNAYGHIKIEHSAIRPYFQINDVSLNIGKCSTLIYKHDDSLVTFDPSSIILETNDNSLRIRDYRTDTYCVISSLKYSVAELTQSGVVYSSTITEIKDTILSVNLLAEQQPIVIQGGNREVNQYMANIFKQYIVDIRNQVIDFLTICL